MLVLVYYGFVGFLKRQNKIFNNSQVFRQKRRIAAPSTLLGLLVVLLVLGLIGLTYVYLRNDKTNSPEKIANIFMDAVTTGDTEQLNNFRFYDYDSMVQYVLKDAIEGSAGDYALIESLPETDRVHYLYSLTNEHNKYARVTVKTLDPDDYRQPLFIHSYVFSPEPLDARPNIAAADAATPKGCIRPSDLSYFYNLDKPDLYEDPRLYFHQTFMMFKDASLELYNGAIYTRTANEELTRLAKFSQNYSSDSVSYLIIPHAGKDSEQDQSLQIKRGEFLAQQLTVLGVSKASVSIDENHPLVDDGYRGTVTILVRSTCANN